MDNQYEGLIRGLQTTRAWDAQARAEEQQGKMLEREQQRYDAAQQRQGLLDQFAQEQKQKEFGLRESDMALKQNQYGLKERETGIKESAYVDKANRANRIDNLERMASLHELLAQPDTTPDDLADYLDLIAKSGIEYSRDDDGNIVAQKGDNVRTFTPDQFIEYSQRYRNEAMNLRGKETTAQRNEAKPMKGLTGTVEGESALADLGKYFDVRPHQVIEKNNEKYVIGIRPEIRKAVLDGLAKGESFESIGRRLKLTPKNAPGVTPDYLAKREEFEKANEATGHWFRGPSAEEKQRIASTRQDMMNTFKKGLGEFTRENFVRAGIVPKIPPKQRTSNPMSPVSDVPVKESLGNQKPFTMNEFIDDFFKETNRKPTQKQIDAAKGKYWTE